MHHHLRNLNKQKLFNISDLFIKSLFLRYRRPALVDDPNARENKYHRYTLLPSEVVQTNDDADDGGDDGLHIVVHADQSGSQALLPDGDEEIRDESGEKHHKSNLPRHTALNLSKRYEYQVFDIEGNGHQHGEQEHPLHESDHIVFRDEWAEDAEIEGEGQAVDDHEDDAQRLGFGSATAQSHRVENQDQNACQTHQNTAHFLESDGNRPSMEAMKIFHRSFSGTFSLGMNRDRIQNSSVAPAARKHSKSMGVITCALEMFLQQTMLNPKMQ